ncbi:MAG: S1 RNA-binding domain-containing protein, partial [Deltaproteobacteria bacterium]|nr:S1 RNA-binding domain-containing protein [Deltaproteobacteria bacterium]
GTVRRIMDYGAFVEIFPGTDGLVHISEIDKVKVMSVSEFLKEGDVVPVKVVSIDQSGRIKLSRKAALYPDEPRSDDAGESRPPRRDSRPPRR